MQSIQALEDSVKRILENSFDADSRVCLVTLMKVLDNVLHKPADDRVRTIRLGNAAFSKKVASRPGGVEFLSACGFTRRQASDDSLGGRTGGGGDETLVLEPQNEKQSRLLTARRLLRRRAMEDLQMKEEELPVFRTPPALVGDVTTSTDAAGGSVNAFNPYVGHRYDAQSAAVGANLGPDADYVSPTDRQLRALQTQKSRLERRAARQFHDGDRGWRAWTTASSGETTVRSSAESQDAAAAATKSDATLLAQRAKAQEEARQQREQGGFTTSAMRQVAALKHKKVYSHVQITVQFATTDQIKLTGKFLPRETVGTVLEAMRRECFLDATRQVDLYVAPPRRLLPLQATLEQEGLAPAAKVFASWKVGSAPDAGQAFLRPHLFQRGGDETFPSAQPIAKKDDAEEEEPAESKATAAPRPKKKKESREELMLKRMMGKK